MSGSRYRRLRGRDPSDGPVPGGIRRYKSGSQARHGRGARRWGRVWSWPRAFQAWGDDDHLAQGRPSPCRCRSPSAPSPARLRPSALGDIGRMVEERRPCDTRPANNRSISFCDRRPMGLEISANRFALAAIPPPRRAAPISPEPVRRPKETSHRKNPRHER